MPYTPIIKGATGTADIINNNFQYIGDGTRLPMIGNSLTSTDSVLDLGSDTYRFGKTYLGDIDNIDGLNNSWYYLTGAIDVTGSSYKFTGLNGDADIMYKILIAFNPNAAGWRTFLINDDITTVYGDQLLEGEGVVDGDRNGSIAGIKYGDGAGVNDISYAHILLYAKTGYPRTIITEILSRSKNATTGSIHVNSAIWNNTTDTITSLNFLGLSAQTISSIRIWARR